MELSKEEVENLINEKIKIAEKQFGKGVKMIIIEIIGLERLLNPEQKSDKRSRIIPLSEWKKYHPYPSERALRNYYANREENGFTECVEYGGENGGRILINEDKYFIWQESRKKIKP